MTDIITPVFDLMRRKTTDLIGYMQFYYVYTELAETSLMRLILFKEVDKNEIQR